MPMTPFVGFAPDASPTTPGIFTACDHVVPEEKGFAASGSPLSVGVATLAAECRGAFVGIQLSGARRVIAGTQTKLYELSSTTWTDRSAGGGSYTGSADSRWSFCQFGDTTIASNLTDAMQGSASGAFAAIAAAPKAKIVVSASNNFVIAFGTNEGTYGNSPDRWWCCAQNDQTTWTPNIATGANTGRLISVGGGINAALELGDYVIAYKDRAVFLGQFAGPAVVAWQWTRIPGSEAGAVGPEAVCNIGTAHFMISPDRLWLFDGTRPQEVGAGVVRDWFNANCSNTYRFRVKCSYDRQRNVVNIDFPSLNSTGACDSRLVYHCAKNQFGLDNNGCEAPLQYQAAGVTIDGLAAYAATYDALPNVPYDSPFWNAGGRLSAYFNSSHQLVANTGVPGASSFTTGDLGDDFAVTYLDTVRVRFTQAPTTATCTGQTKANEGEAFADGDAVAIEDGKFDMRQTARWHRVRFDMTGVAAFSGVDGKPKFAGWR